MVNVPPKSSKWVDIDRDIRMAQIVEPQLPFSGGNGPDAALDKGDLAPKTKAKLKRTDATAAGRRRSLVTTATKTRP